MTLGTAAWQLPSALAPGTAEQTTLGAVVSLTVKVVVQVALLVAASVAVTVIVCVPNPTSVPAAGDWLKVIEPAPLQASLTLTPPITLGTAAWQLPSTLAPGTAEQTTLGAVASLTVKVVVQVALLVAASVVVTVIACVPNPPSVPAAGDCLKVIEPAPLQASLTLTPPITLGTAAWQLPSALAPGTAEQTTLGAVVSLTVKVVVQVALLVASSVAVTVIVWVPRPTSVPAAGDWLKVIALAALQASLTLTPPITLGTAAWQFPSALAPGTAEQITVGAVVSLTVKVAVQLALLPASSVAMTLIECVPRPTSVPAAGDWLKVIALAALQASLTLTPPITLGRAAWQFPSALAPGTAEQITVGAVLSVTVKVVVQVALLPASSVAMTLIECVPRPTSVPAAGDWLKVIALAALQASLTLTPPMTLGTAAWQFPSALAPGTAEQITVGAVVSLTVKVVVQLALFPASSVAVTVIVWVPRPTSVPAASDWLKVIALAAVQASLTLTPLITLGTAAWQFPSALAPGTAKQITVGAVLSLTVKVAVQVTLLPASSVAVTVTVCAPKPTRVPAAGF